jgi:N-acyl-D-amino-acid deacylase
MLCLPSVSLSFAELLDDDSLKGLITRGAWDPESKRWGRLYPILDGFDYEPPPELSVRGICDGTNRAILEFVYDHMTTEGATGTIWEGGYSDVSRFYNHAHKQLQSELVIPGISDAGAHLNIFQDGTSPTTMLSFWVRDRVR